jgi:hypothetical protein
MLQIQNVLGAGFSHLPYPTDDTTTMGQYLRTVIAPLLHLKPRDDTVPVHVQTLESKPLVFHETNCDRPLRSLIRDGTTLVYFLSPPNAENNVGNAGTQPLDDCAICLSKLRVKCFTLLCGHSFHCACIHTCFKKDKKTLCPICKRDVHYDVRTCEWWANFYKQKA